MGKVASCTQLLIWIGEKSEIDGRRDAIWSGNLSSLQQRAADEWVASIRMQKSHLVNAVCGAGKTEIMFRAIQEMLTLGHKICVAAPRTDVILELFPRFLQAFPTIPIHALYGGAPKQVGSATITLATTHQLYHYLEAFDQIILDEADAFPYSTDQSLMEAVRKALKVDGVLHFISATPSSALTFHQQSIISKRFHGHPLPVPRFEKLMHYKRQLNRQMIPRPLDNWVTVQLQKNLPFLIFLPTIRLLEDFPGNMERVHSEHPLRKERVLQLRNKEIPGLLTTTILERGITIENLQVAVVGAEQPIFTNQALIQIAGRAGRSSQFPTGDVVFFHHGISDAMITAQKTIKRLNQA